VGEAGEYSLTSGVAFEAGLLWGRGAHGPESRAGLGTKWDSSTPGVGTSGAGAVREHCRPVLGHPGLEMLPCCPLEDAFSK